MKRLVSSLIYLLSSILLLSFIVIFLTENSNLIPKLYKKDIISSIEKRTSLEYRFENLSIKWDGLNPSLIFEDISLHNKTMENHYLDSKKMILRINFLKSISKLKIIPEEIDLVESNIDLIYNQKGIFIKDYNLLGDANTNEEDFEDIKLRVTNSKITINDKVNSDNHELLNMNMVILKQKSEIKVFTTFNHQSSKEIIHLASYLSFDNNNINGKVYSQGINVSLDKPITLYKKLGFSADNVDYIFWANIVDNKFVDVQASINISESIIFNNLTKDRLTLNNVSAKTFFKSESGASKLSFDNLSFITANSKYKDNSLRIAMNNGTLSNISINELNINDVKNSLRLLAFPTRTMALGSLDLIDNGNLSDILLLNLDRKKSFKYKLSFRQIGLQNKGLKISNVSGMLKGDHQIGYLDLDSKDVGLIYRNDKYYANDINGKVYFKYIDNKFLLSSKKIKVDDVHDASISGTFSDKQTNFKIDINGKVDNVLSDLPASLNLDKLIKTTKVRSNYKIDYRIFKTDKKTYTYGAISLSNLIAKNESSDISFNTKKIRINFFDLYLQSYASKVFLNNNEFSFSIDTDITNGTPKYIANSNGVLTDRFIKSFVDHKIVNSFKGAALADIQLIHETKNKKTYIKLNSDLQGFSFNLISPFKKDIESTKNFELSYQIQENQRNALNIKYDMYKMQLSGSEDSLFAVIDSPYLSGTLMLPDKITINNRLTARLKYFDLNKFQGIADPSEYPYLEMDMKKVKINKHYFDDFKIKTSPTEKGMVIDELNFSNKHLTMTGNGKWLNADDGQITLFDAKFSSDNFGKSLATLGYKDLIKEGKLSSQLIGQWRGSPDYFSLNDFDGKITINLENGEFLQVSKQSRAIGQLLGLFSISSLQKRLSLDFSDFFSSGLSFDNMNGEFVFLSSKANANDLNLKGSFGEMRVNGTSDLKNKTHDQKLTYIPDLSSMSLISGTLLGGPVGALASIFYDKFLEQVGIDTNQLAAVEYSIKGSWDDPEIKVIESFKPIAN
ncbi:MAG: AsmA-like C-terminal region-containing protein [Pseudomonadota bacterium]|nr:AsmA-like C-terminal region-containing protein [Pseudomonadota bacterium]